MFKTFPEFTKLTLEHKKEYEGLIRSYPPISEFSFTTMMTWWNVLGTAAVARLNGNLVLSNWFPEDPDNSGFSVVGLNKVDETFCEVLDHLSSQGEPTRLVHVSEFVLTHLRFPELFRLTGERDYDEYVMAASSIYPLENAMSTVRPKIKKLQMDLSRQEVVVKQLDLRSSINQAILLGQARKWWSENGVLYKSPKAVLDSMATVVTNANALDIDNICLYVDGELKGFYLYQLTHQADYAIANYWEIDPTISGLNEFMLYSCAEWLARKGVKYINLDLDLGSHFSRTQQIITNPAYYFRKYTVEPV